MPGGDFTDALHQKIDRLEAELAAAKEDTARLDCLCRLVFNGDVNIHVEDRSISLCYRDSGTHRCEADGRTFREAIDAARS